MRAASLLAVVVLALSACATTRPAEPASVTVARPPAEAYAVAMRTAAAYGWSVTHSADAALLFTATYQDEASRWGDTVSVTVAEAPGGAVVTARGTLPHGPNARHVAGFLSAVAEAAR